ncbi:hypothetical protein NADE_001651 [Nannochloris sp. 'desiccata']|nr:hypothetical protein KSW81_001491 [Chlorella desiccata (nom. nud.)]KAH7616844.1 hypothetical protein NADE_001651 [Chlorella desiccata (nom. nud.)]
MHSLATPTFTRNVAYPAQFLKIKNSSIPQGRVTCSVGQNRHHDTQHCLSSRRHALLAPLLSLGLASILPKPALAEILPSPSPAQNTATGASPSSQAPSSPPTKAPSSSINPTPREGSEAQTQPGSSNSSPSSSKVPKGSTELSEEAAKKLSAEQEERKRGRKKGKGRIRELQEIRAELAEKELVLLEKQQELLEKEQTVMVLREELEIERKLRALLSKQVKKAEEEAALAMGLCGVGGSMLP